MSSSSINVTMETAIKSAIKSAFLQLKGKEYTVTSTFEEFADEMIVDLFAILFPMNPSSDVVIPVVELAKKTKKTKTAPVEGEVEKPKKVLSPEHKAKLLVASAAAREAKKAAKAAEPVAVVPADPVAVAEPSPSKVKKVLSPEHKAKLLVASAAAREAKKAAKAAELSPPSTEAAVVVDAPVAAAVNLDKMTPTQLKKLKAVAEELKIDADKKMVISYLNAMSVESFNAKKLEDHFRDFLTPVPTEAPVAPVAITVPTDLMVVDFNGKEYFVDAESKRVFVGAGRLIEETGGWSAYDAVGYVGMSEFADMEIPEDDE